MDVVNFLKGLTASELEIECYVRGLNVQQSGCKELLAQAFLIEEQDRTKKPLLSHIPQQSTPESEIELCRVKCSELNLQMTALGPNPPLDSLCLALCKAKHYKDRADRVVNSFGNIDEINTVASSLRRIVNYYFKILNDKTKQSMQPPLALASDTNAILNKSFKQKSPEHLNFHSNPSPGASTDVSQPHNIDGGPNKKTSPKFATETNRTGAIPKLTTKTIKSLNNPNSTDIGLSRNEEGILQTADPNLILAIAEIMAKVQIAKNDILEQEQRKMSASFEIPDPNACLSSNEHGFNNNRQCESQLRNQHQERHQPEQSEEFFFTPRAAFNEYTQRDFTYRLKQRWNLSFDGGDSSNVKDFIYRFETLARDDGIPEASLVRCLHMFLSNKAHDWYWVYKQNTPCAKWTDIRDALIAYFTSYESEDETREMIIRRFQGSKESFADFALDIQKLNGRLRCKLTVSQLINRLCLNMNPALRNVTLSHQASFKTIEDLRVICQRYEKMWSQTGYDPRNFIDPVHRESRRRPRINELDDCCESQHYCKKGKLLKENNVTEMFVQNETIAAVQQAQHKLTDSEKRDYVICWNCKEMGHTFFDCNEDVTRKFCFGCGCENVRKPDCFNCQKRKSENWKSSVNFKRDPRLDSNQLAPMKSNIVNHQPPPTS